MQASKTQNPWSFFKRGIEVTEKQPKTIQSEEIKQFSDLRTKTLLLYINYHNNLSLMLGRGIKMALKKDLNKVLLIYDFGYIVRSFIYVFLHEVTISWGKRCVVYYYTGIIRLLTFLRAKLLYNQIEISLTDLQRHAQIFRPYLRCWLMIWTFFPRI